jgi:class 3 adenylate cyclase
MTDTHGLKFLFFQRFRKRLLVFLLVQLILAETVAQAPIYLNDSTESIRIGKNVFYIEDHKAEIDFPGIISGKYNNSYVRSDKESPNFGNVELTTWNKFTVVNNSSHHWLLLVDNYSLDTLNFYYPDSSGQYKEIKSGRCIPFSERKYKTSVYAFDLNVPKGDSAVFYVKVSSYFMQYPMIIMTREKFLESYHSKDLMVGFYYGFLVLIIIYNFFLYFYVHEKSYLYYVAYIIFNGLLIAQLKGFIAEAWGDQFHFMWQYATVVIAISSAMGFLFLQYILETKKYAPLSFRIMIYVFQPLYGIIILLGLVNQNLYSSLLNQLVGLVGLLIMYITGVYIYRKGFRFVRFYIAACWSYFAGIVVFVLKAFTILPYSTFTNNAIEIGSTVQMIIFSFLIADKVNAYKKEKAQVQKDLVLSLQENEKLITEQNITLENEVEKRTRELQTTLSALEISQQELQQKNIAVTLEKERSDNLLLNILPFETARELKETGSAEAKYFENVTVLFTDFKDFTIITEHMEPAILVAKLDHCFKAFDRIIDKYEIEKIKTIGDSYMAVAGLPVADSEAAEKAVKAAMDIQAFMESYNREILADNQAPFEIRIGLHTGSVVAGIVGFKKFAYDIWGDTVNTASRLENAGVPGKINISATTYEMIKDKFICTHRGKIAVKSKGDIDMYFVDGLR